MEAFEIASSGMVLVGLFLLLDVVLQLALGCIESVAQSDVDIFVSLLIRVFAVDDDLPAGDRKDDVHAIKVPLSLVSVRRRDDNPATDDAVVEAC